MNIKYIWAKLFSKLHGKALNGARVHKTSKVEANSIVINSSFDKYSFCGYNCKIINTKIGAFTSIADNVTIGVAEHPIDWVSTSPVFYRGKDSVKKKFSEFEREPSKMTNIGNDVWIGENATIRAGVKVGDGSVIGMGAVVTRDVKSYEIVGGVPAKNIRYRFNEDIIEKLLESKWWDKDEAAIKHAAKYIKNPVEFLEEI